MVQIGQGWTLFFSFISMFIVGMGFFMFIAGIKLMLWLMK